MLIRGVFSLENEYIYCLGYKVFKNGRIIGLRGNEIKPAKQIKVKIKNKYHNVEWNKFVYFAFHQENKLIPNNLVVKSKDGTSNLESLYLQQRNENLKRENRENTKLTDKQVKKILIEYKLGSIKDKELDKHNPNRRVSYRSLAEKYNVSHVLIRNIILGDGHNR